MSITAFSRRIRRRVGRRAEDITGPGETLAAADGVGGKGPGKTLVAPTATDGVGGKGPGETLAAADGVGGMGPGETLAAADRAASKVPEGTLAVSMGADALARVVEKVVVELVVKELA